MACGHLHMPEAQQGKTWQPRGGGATLSSDRLWRAELGVTHDYVTQEGNKTQPPHKDVQPVEEVQGWFALKELRGSEGERRFCGQSLSPEGPRTSGLPSGYQDTQTCQLFLRVK